MTSEREGTVLPAKRGGDDDGVTMLIVAQWAASEARLFDTCPLPRCRRARRCSGCRRSGSGSAAVADPKSHPPCILTDEDAQRLHAGLAAVRRHITEILAQPMPDDEESDDGEDKPIAWPQPRGLPRLRRRGRHGGRRAKAGKALSGVQETPSDSAEIQNTASCDSAVSSQTKSRCGNSSSRISRPEPISQIMPPSGLR